jgi:hypothetical protein
MIKNYQYYIKESKEDIGRRVRIKDSSIYRKEAYDDVYDNGKIGNGEGKITRFYDNDEKYQYAIKWNNDYEDSYGIEDFEFVEEDNKPVRTRWYKDGILEKMVNGVEYSIGDKVIHTSAAEYGIGAIVEFIEDNNEDGEDVIVYFPKLGKRRRGKLSTGYYEIVGKEEDNKPVRTRWYKDGILENYGSQVGLKVKINDGSEYREQAYFSDGDGYGEIISHSPGNDYCYRVKWNNGLEYNYRKTDIKILDEEKKEKKKLKPRLRWYSDGKLVEDPDTKIVVAEYDDFIADNEFREFLIENGAYEKYIKNFLSQHSSPHDYFKSHFGQNVIDNTLSWSSCPEGSSYWGDLNDKWIARWRRNR